MRDLDVIKQFENRAGPFGTPDYKDNLPRKGGIPYRKCTICDTEFAIDGRSTTCSAVCKAEHRRRMNVARMFRNGTLSKPPRPKMKKETKPKIPVAKNNSGDRHQKYVERLSRIWSGSPESNESPRKPEHGPAANPVYCKELGVWFRSTKAAVSYLNRPGTFHYAKVAPAHLRTAIKRRTKCRRLTFSHEGPDEGKPPIGKIYTNGMATPVIVTQIGKVKSGRVDSVRQAAIHAGMSGTHMNRLLSQGKTTIPKEGNLYQYERIDGAILENKEHQKINAELRRIENAI